MEPTTLYAGVGMALILIGLAGILLRTNLIKIVLGFTLVGTGTHILIIALGFVKGGTAPIIDDPEMLQKTAEGALLVQSGVVMDPVTQAMVLTAIVIGVGVTGLMLAYVVRLYAVNKDLDVNNLTRLKW